MSSDLTFITNEKGQSLANRFSTLLGVNTRFFDSLVGYFFISGFHRLYPSLATTEKIRILIGLKTDQATFSLLQQAQKQDFILKSHAEAKERLPAEILSELEHAEDTAVLEKGVATFLEWVRNGKLEIKVYPSEHLHAKLYIMTFVDGHIDKGRVITGSSNFSQSGLQDNLEFNVELKNRADYEFALQKFNQLWADAVEVSKSYVDTIDLKSPFAQFSPYELYLKFLYEYFKGELNQQEEFESLYVPAKFKKLKYQDDAVSAAKKILDEYGGVFVSDVVGLGKTYVSAMLAQRLDGRTLVIAPPALLDEQNPGSWPNVFRDFQVRQSKFQSSGKLDELLEMGVENYENIFIDESHRFRTETNQTYEKLAQICRGKRVVLVTATPLNNYPRDILSQIKLFQNGKNSTIPNVRDLEAFFGRLERKLKGLDRQRDRQAYFATVQANAKEIREKVLKYLMIRRTRTEISKYYAADLKEQSLKFPEVADPEALFYEFDEYENQVFNRTIELLARDFSYARYRPLTYYTGEWAESEVVAQWNLAKFMKILLVKRLESSFHAFRLSLQRFIGTYERFIAEYQKGHVFISKKHTHKIFELLEVDDMEAVQRLLDADLAQKLAAADFNQDFIRDLKNDLKILSEIHGLWEKVSRDPKWEKLASSLKRTAVLKDHKVILFTESKETAVYLASRLKRELKEKAILFSGDSDQPTREQVIQNFDARAWHPKNDFRLLVTTEVLSEGVNLHRSNVVLNYDIPWNPTRLIQRVGRINRVDTPFEKIHTFNFFPTEQGNDLIKLKEAAEAKIHAFIEMLGADARLLTEGEEIKSHDLFQQLFSKKALTGEDEEEESELEYLAEIRQVRDANPDLFERIKRLPKKARSAKKHHSDAGSLVTYFRKGKLEKFFISTLKSPAAQELDFIAAVKTLKCAADTQREQTGPDFYSLLDANKSAFVLATTEDAKAEPAGNSRDNPAKILKRLRTREIRHFKGFTDEDQEYLLKVIRLLEDGALPRPTTKKVAEAFKTEINALKLLAILKRDIPVYFFQATRAEKTRSDYSRREVILSEYLVAH
jgi:superfamily II DNA/RNA helicase